VIRFLMLAGLIASLAGCAPDLSALSADKNADCVTETSVWVTVSFNRNWGCNYPPPGFQLVPIAR
jgi:hypothetical protein